MKHLGDDDLVLYQDGEIRTAPAEKHLHVCRGCRDRLQALDLEIDLLKKPPSAGPAPPPPKIPAWHRLLRWLAGLASRPD